MARNWLQRLHERNFWPTWCSLAKDSNSCLGTLPWCRGAANRCKWPIAEPPAREGDGSVVEGVKETVVADPFALLHQHLVHEFDLPGRAAETQETDLGPDPECLAEGDMIRIFSCSSMTPRLFMRDDTRALPEVAWSAP